MAIITDHPDTAWTDEANAAQGFAIAPNASSNPAIWVEAPVSELPPGSKASGYFYWPSGVLRTVFTTTSEFEIDANSAVFNGSSEYWIKYWLYIESDSNMASGDAFRLFGGSTTTPTDLYYVYYTKGSSPGANEPWGVDEADGWGFSPHGNSKGIQTRITGGAVASATNPPVSLIPNRWNEIIIRVDNSTGTTPVTVGGIDIICNGVRVSSIVSMAGSDYSTAVNIRPRFDMESGDPTFPGIRICGPVKSWDAEPTGVDAIIPKAHLFAKNTDINHAVLGHHHTENSLIINVTPGATTLIETQQPHGLTALNPTGTFDIFDVGGITGGINGHKKAATWVTDTTFTTTDSTAGSYTGNGSCGITARTTIAGSSGKYWSVSGSDAALVRFGLIINGQMHNNLGAVRALLHNSGSPATAVLTSTIDVNPLPFNDLGWTTITVHDIVWRANSTGTIVIGSPNGLSFAISSTGVLTQTNPTNPTPLHTLSDTERYNLNLHIHTTGVVRWSLLSEANIFTTKTFSGVLKGLATSLISGPIVISVTVGSGSTQTNSTEIGACSINRWLLGMGTSSLVSTYNNNAPAPIRAQISSNIITNGFANVDALSDCATPNTYSNFEHLMEKDEHREVTRLVVCDYYGESGGNLNGDAAGTNFYETYFLGMSEARGVLWYIQDGGIINDIVDGVTADQLMVTVKLITEEVIRRGDGIVWTTCVERDADTFNPDSQAKVR